MFPNKKFLFFNDGWKDLGEINSTSEIIENQPRTRTLICAFCKDVLHIGKENGKLFRFCKRCEVKIKK